MIPKTKKLFISYRSSDAPKVDKIALDLGLLQYDDGTPRYKTWQDKIDLPPASPHWWDAIVDAIVDCDVFVFNMSKASLQSEVCQAELDYAHKRNRPIIPLVLEGEFFLDPNSGKYNIAYWELVPDWLRDVQFLFYVGADFYRSFQTAIELFERNWSRDINAQRPMHPDSNSVYGSNHALYDAACDYAQRLAFADAEKHFDTLIRRNVSDYADVAAEWLELLRLYAELIEIDESRSAHFIFQSKWQAYQALFPKNFLQSTFDPKGIGKPKAPKAAPIVQTVSKPAQAPQMQAVAPSIVTPTRPTSLSLLPAPFDWIEIQGKGYDIAKYPVTNTQFKKFIEAEGYKTQIWWTKHGWQAREKGWELRGKRSTPTPSENPWSEPLHWRDSEFNGDTQPVVGISWHEAVAFCLWLSNVTGEKIMLLTKDQWLYTAQGNENRTYPWGNDWDGDLCNNNVDGKGVGITTSVTQYDGKGNSPFGVVDMVGNVYEWCLSDNKGQKNDISSDSKNRGMIGGCFASDILDEFDLNDEMAFAFLSPHDRFNINGFRISRLG